MGRSSGISTPCSGICPPIPMKGSFIASLVANVSIWFLTVTCNHSNRILTAFRQMSTLSQHKAIHSTARPYVCQICNKNFNRVSTLISHSKTHTGVKPHRCHLCNKAFHQKGVNNITLCGSSNHKPVLLIFNVKLITNR